MRYQVRLHPTLDVLVSSIGEVFVPANGAHKAHWTFGSKNKKGYLQVKINGKTCQVHRLVAGAFIGPNPDNKPQIDHSNRDRKDNRVENLSYCTSSGNNRNTSRNDRVDVRGGTHWYENEKQYVKEKNARFRKTRKLVRFANGKHRWVLNSEALELLKIPVKDRIWHPHR